MSDLFEGIAGQDQVTSYLQRSLDAHKVTHAYLIAGGADGEGARIARRFAAGLVAGDDEEQLDLATRDVHPDLHVYAPGGAEGYLVEQIRELTHDVELAPIRASKKAYVIQDAHRLAGAPANAFLKTLEEPPRDVTCILVANNESAVLETLRSRCEVLVLNVTRVARAANTQVFEMLDMLARGCDNRMLLANSKRFVEIAAEQAEAMGADSIDAEAYIEKYDEYLSQGAKKEIELQGKREATAHERAAFAELCALARLWLRDCLVAREGSRDLLAYPQYADQIVKVAHGTTERDLLSALDAVKTAQARISYNVTPQLAIDAMFLEIREALCHK